MTDYEFQAEGGDKFLFGVERGWVGCSVGPAFKIRNILLKAGP